MTSEERIRQILRLVLKAEVPDEGEIGRDALREWDSLKHVEIIFAIEDEFGVQFTEAQMEEIESLSSIIRVLEVSRES